MNLVVAVLGLMLATSDPSPETVVRQGRVVTLVSALEDRKIPADPGPIADQVVLLEADGTITPLLSDESSRALRLSSKAATGWRSH